jgi:predicted glycosyltransferase
VFVSLEKGVNDPFYDDYVLNISPEKMHDLEANAKFMVAEGATMASEAFLLGVPYLYLNPLMVGYIDYQCTHYSNRCFKTTDGNEALKIVNQLMDIQIDGDAERKKVEEQTINPTEYLVKFVENYR